MLVLIIRARACLIAGICACWQARQCGGPPQMLRRINRLTLRIQADTGGMRAPSQLNGLKATGPAYCSSRKNQRPDKGFRFGSGVLDAPYRTGASVRICDTTQPLGLLCHLGKSPGAHRPAGAFERVGGHAPVPTRRGMTQLVDRPRHLADEKLENHAFEIAIAQGVAGKVRKIERANRCLIRSGCSRMLPICCDTGIHIHDFFATSGGDQYDSRLEAFQAFDQQALRRLMLPLLIQSIRPGKCASPNF